MNKTDLMKYAEDGVRNRLLAMQREINELARLFPHIVKNQDGTVPAVTPIEPKEIASSNGHVTSRLPTADRVAAIANYLTAHPGATTEQMSAAVGVSKAHVYKLAREVATTTGRIGNKPAHWVLKKSHHKQAK